MDLLTQIRELEWWETELTTLIDRGVKNRDFFSLTDDIRDPLINVLERVNKRLNEKYASLARSNRAAQNV